MQGCHTGVDPGRRRSHRKISLVLQIHCYCFRPYGNADFTKPVFDGTHHRFHVHVSIPGYPVCSVARATSTSRCVSYRMGSPCSELLSKLRGSRCFSSKVSVRRACSNMKYMVIPRREMDPGGCTGLYLLVRLVGEPGPVVAKPNDSATAGFQDLTLYPELEIRNPDSVPILRVLGASGDRRCAQNQCTKSTLLQRFDSQGYRVMKDGSGRVEPVWEKVSWTCIQKHLAITSVARFRFGGALRCDHQRNKPGHATEQRQVSARFSAANHLC